jgi:hypothetical protein
MDADEWQVYTEALITGSGYVSVSGDPPRLAPESEPRSRTSRRRASAAAWPLR